MSLDIFIPYWGDPEYMKETVQSVLDQENPNWLLTVVDDDYPGTVIEDYLATLGDPRITYIRKEKNAGITANFRTCVQLATQDIVVIIGCDDVMLPHYVDTVLAAHAEFPEAGIIQPGVEVIDENGRIVSPLVDSVKQRVVRPRTSGRTLLAGDRLGASLLHGDWLYWPSLTFRRASIQSVDFREGFPIIQDLALIMDLLFAGETLVFDPVVCFRYRRHSASASVSQLSDGSRFVGERAYFALAATLARKNGWPRTRRAAKLRITSRAHALSLIPGSLLRGNVAAVRVLTRHALGR
ncbi:hypothetical protein GCM10022198_09950 [Klugiella xanthotipulae]|uniref:GT2 family glycosyltransferase n=1 Tax=Klugiella xanthotipulae TaxID=244735 RepID=A0A543HYH9_9MICO|nr:glycosyltransferase [Klugiella xanthotipulae]TQM63393.1 GT2 family glycosyltransferase [Klugiella xanthotipulae]